MLRRNSLSCFLSLSVFLVLRLCPSYRARQDVHLSYRYWVLHKINRLASLTLIPEWKGSPSQLALCEPVFSPPRAHTASSVRSITLVPAPAFFPLSPYLVPTTFTPYLPPSQSYKSLIFSVPFLCSLSPSCQQRQTFTADHKSLNFSNKTHRFPATLPTLSANTCY